MKIGFIGLGNLGGKLAGSLLRNGHQLVVRDLDRTAALPFLEAGAEWVRHRPRSGPAQRSDHHLPSVAFARVGVR